MTKSHQREFLLLARDWLACRLAVLGGAPLSPLHRPVRDFETLAWAMLGMHDYAWEMRLLCEEYRQRAALV